MALLGLIRAQGLASLSARVGRRLDEGSFNPVYLNPIAALIFAQGDYIETAIVRCVLRVGELIITGGVTNAPLFVGGDRGECATEAIARPEPYLDKHELMRWVYRY